MFYAVEVVTFFNRGMRSERAYATGEYDYYSDASEARVHADARGVSVIPCEREGALDTD